MLTEKLEQLLENQPFATLSVEDKAYVLQHLTKEEYNEMHLLLSQAKPILQRSQVQVNPALAGQLTQHFKQYHGINESTAIVKTWWQQLFVYQVPAWQASLAAILLLLYVNFNRPKEIIIADALPEKVYVYQTDTIYKEKAPVASTDSVAAKFPVRKKRLPKIVNVKPSLSTGISKGLEEEQMSNLENLSPDNNGFQFSDFDKYAKGRTAKEDSSLMHMINTTRNTWSTGL